ncbi:MAG TPA: hypothetical protein VFM19_03805 [Candidatus Limnocylindria bacterium]|nr:hypothetical protein [Candidatus Limnocylindria bacterium]
MSTQTRRTASTRAEARRRARLAAQGQLLEEEMDEAPAPATTRTTTGGGILARLFPPAPPLPGKPDPLAGFSYRGPLPGLMSTLWLLGRHPVSWVLPGIVWAISYFATNAGRGSFVSLVASLGTFAALVGAGWIGWQRPWAFGAAASILGQLGFGGLLGVLALNGVDVDGPNVTIPVEQAAVSLITSGIFMAPIGALAGFYGGYLRRRLAQPRTSASTRRR